MKKGCLKLTKLWENLKWENCTLRSLSVSIILQLFLNFSRSILRILINKYSHKKRAPKLICVSYIPRSRTKSIIVVCFHSISFSSLASLQQDLCDALLKIHTIIPVAVTTFSRVVGNFSDTDCTTGVFLRS